MTQRETAPSDRSQKHAALLKEALDRPGVYEAMKVFHNWQRTDRWLDAYRAATRERHISITSDRSNPR